MSFSKSFAKTTRTVAEDAQQRADVSGSGGAGGSITGTGQAPALVLGVSPAPIVANIAGPNTQFIFSLKSQLLSTALGIPKATSVLPGTPGSFTIQSLTPGTPAATETGDLSIYDYTIIN